MNCSLRKLKTVSKICFGLNLSFLAPIAAAENATVAEEKKIEQSFDLNLVSEAFGHLIGKNLQTLGLEFDVHQVIKGIQDSIAGKDSPMSETDCVQAISLHQEQIFQKQAKTNLEQAEEFLVKNSKKEGIIEIEPNKLQYKVDQVGSGETVKPHCTPTIRYTGKFQDGNVFGASTEGEAISLDETLPGFTKAVVGMREGEKRTIYIHPELGYGTAAGYLPPNSLLTFEIEVVKADTPQAELQSGETASDEIVDSAQETPAIR